MSTTAIPTVVQSDATVKRTAAALVTELVAVEQVTAKLVATTTPATTVPRASLEVMMSPATAVGQMTLKKMTQAQATRVARIRSSTQACRAHGPQAVRRRIQLEGLTRMR
jgi:hypothetical protein